MASSALSTIGPWSEPFRLLSTNSSLFIEPVANPSLRTRLHIKGANWAGFQADGCVHELWRHTVSSYISFLVEHDFNAVRLPLSAYWVNEDGAVGSNCGSYAGQPSLTVLDDVLTRLVRSRGLKSHPRPPPARPGDSHFSQRMCMW